MSNSVFSQKLKESFKNKRLNELSPEDKNEYRLKTIENVFEELSNKENRFILYCPDIVIVNHIVKKIYDIAYALHKSNFNVIILHEIKGYKCNWLFQEKKYSDYKDLKVEYIIEKKSKKSKKEKNTYTFKPTDTLIVPDVFQDMLENLKEVTLLQKVVLITSYAGITNLIPGTSYKNLNVSSAIFLDKKVKEDYESLYPELTKTYLLNENDMVDEEIFNKEKVNNKEIYPVIGISKLGNEKLAQQVTNLFYNKFPNLRVFAFKILDRENYDEYVESLKHCCLYFNLDDTLGFREPLIEAMKMGIPTATYNRRELETDAKFKEEVVVATRDAFSIVEFLGNFCSYWLTNSNVDISNYVLNYTEELLISNLELKNMQQSVIPIFEDLHQERIKFFASIKKTIEGHDSNEKTA